MRSSDFILLFFIIYDAVLTWLFFFIYWRTKERNIEQSSYINDLELELAKMREKCYSKTKEDNDGGKRTN